MMHRLACSLPPGVLAAGPALLALALGPIILGGPGILEIVADGVLRLVPVTVFEAGLRLLGPLAKGVLLAGVAFAAVAVGGLLGLVVRRAFRPPTSDRRFGHAAVAAAVALAAAELIVLPLAGAGLLGGPDGAISVALHLPLIAAAVLFGITLAILEVRTPASEPEPVGGLTRRAALVGGMTGVVALAALAASGLVVAGRIAAGSAGARATSRRAPAPGGFGPTPAVTPLEDHYVVAKGLTPPTVDAASWRLVVDGLVAKPIELTLDGVRALTHATATRTLLCISNPVLEFGRYAGTQLWTGTAVAAVLDAAGGPLPDARHVAWASADGYTESIPLDVALDPRSMLAWGMGADGAPLPVEHGFPLRVLLPGRYGMKQPKWLTRITLVAEDVGGFWEQRGWDREAVVRTWSRIDDPLDGDQVPAGVPLPVFGVAFAGERGVGAVEVSPDDGRTWVAAELEAPASPLAWVRWRATVPPPAAGPVLLRVRATDGTGALQSETPEPPLPRGASGWLQVRVVAG